MGTIPEIIVTAPRKNPEPKDGLFEKLDKFTSYAEDPILATLLVCLVPALSAGPAGLAGMTVLNGAGMAIDAYQGIRAALRGDWGSATLNAVEFALGFVGLKALAKATEKLAVKAGSQKFVRPNRIGSPRYRRTPGYWITQSPEMEKFEKQFYATGLGLAIPIGQLVTHLNQNDLSLRLDNTRVAQNIQPTLIRRK